MRYQICSRGSAGDLRASGGDMSRQLSRLLPTALGGDGGKDRESLKDAGT